MVSIITEIKQRGPHLIDPVTILHVDSGSSGLIDNMMT